MFDEDTQKGTPNGVRNSGFRSRVASFSVPIGVSGVLGAPPDWLIAGERDQQFEVAGDSKIISWRFVERVLRSSWQLGDFGGDAPGGA